MDKPILYQEGVERAKAEGHIRSWFQSSDPYSHAQRLSVFNSRILDETSKNVLRAWEGNGPSRILEIGPGSGVAASGMSILSPNSVLHTAGGLTPINPYWRFSRSIVFSTERDTNMRPLAPALQKRIMKAEKRERLPEAYNANELMEIQMRCGAEIFEVLQRPYIDFQWVDSLENAPLEPGSYDFIYESFGPNWHTRDEKTHAKTLKLLSPTGIISANCVIDFRGTEGMYTTSIGSRVISMKPDNFLRQALSEKGESDSRGIYNFGAVRKLLEGIINKRKREEKEGLRQIAKLQ